MQIEQKQNRIFRPQSNTTLSAEESNQVTTELENVIRAGNLTPNAGTLTQVRDAIQNVVDTAADELQEQIDAITSASDVFDVVGTYAQLQAYDTSTVPLNDIIKVLQDETRDNAMTYYRWNGTAWVFIGAEGPYYTVAETDAKFATKAQLPGIATTQQVGLIKPDGQTTIVQQDGTLTVSSNIAASLPLLTPIWSDHLLNNSSYLRGDTFSWQSGSVYTSVYQHLVDDITGKTAETETIAGTTITFYRADDAHKIVLADQESNVAAIFNSTGIAWYLILDTANQRFKLPRSKWNLTGLRTNAGDYVAPGLPDAQGNIHAWLASTAQDPSQISADGVFADTTFNDGGDGGSGQYANAYPHFKLSSSNSIYGNSDTVQPPATQAYLYFYVGNTIQNETSVDVATLAEGLNGKADINLANVSATSGFRKLITSYRQGSSWYKVFAEYDSITGNFIGYWCEQGGVTGTESTTRGQTISISFLKQFADTNYTVIASDGTTSKSTYSNSVGIITILNGTKTATGVSVASYGFNTSDAHGVINWVAKGYIS